MRESDHAERSRLSRRVALVTGASSGLGSHFARVLADAGALVVVTGRRADRLASMAATIRERGGDAIDVTLDVTDPQSVDRAFERIASDLGALDILVNNAGILLDAKGVLDITEQDWRSVVDTNLDGAWRVATAAARQMVAAGKTGSIVNVASIYGLHTGVRKLAYNVSKAGLVQMTKSMAAELARVGIRVNALCPGWFVTELNDAYFATEKGKAYIARIPLGRVGRYEDLTEPLLLLAGDGGAYITGTTLTVDGGILETPI